MTTITFSGVQNGDQTSYTEGDYTFTTPASTGAADGLARVAGNTGNTFGLDDTGIPTIYEDGQNGPVDFGQLANNNGSAFTISSVDVNQLAANASATQTETLKGVRADGTTVTENFTVDTIRMRSRPSISAASPISCRSITMPEAITAFSPS